MPIRIINNASFGDEDEYERFCIHGIMLDSICDECLAQCQHLPIDLNEGEILMITSNDGMEDV